MSTTHPYKINKMSPLLLVADLDSAFEFYSKILLFDLDFRYEDFYMGIKKDGHSIHLKLDESPAHEKRKKQETDHIDLTFAISDIELLHSSFLDKPIEFIQHLRQMPYGKEFYIADPDGHIIAFLE